MTNPPNRPTRQIPAKPARPSGAMGAFGAEEVEKQLAIRDVMEYAVRVTRAAQLAKVMESYSSRPMLLALVSIPSLVVFLYAYAARPAWVFGPDPVRMAPAHRQAYTRFTMYLAAQKVVAYRVQQGVLPGSLADVDEDWAGVSYRPLSATVFELSARGDSGEIVYQSDQPVRQFLGQSAAFLRSREQ